MSCVLAIGSAEPQDPRNVFVHFISRLFHCLLQRPKDFRITFRQIPTYHKIPMVRGCHNYPTPCTIEIRYVSENSETKLSRSSLLFSGWPPSTWQMLAGSWTKWSPRRIWSWWFWSTHDRWVCLKIRCPMIASVKLDGYLGCYMVYHGCYMVVIWYIMVVIWCIIIFPTGTPRFFFILGNPPF